MSKYVSTYVVCPFYRKNYPRIICCEGVSVDSTLSVVFSSKADMLCYERKYCDNIDKHKQCPIYKMLYDKYEKEDKA